MSPKVPTPAHHFPDALHRPRFRAVGFIVRPGNLPADVECRIWADRHITSGNEILVPAIVTYELRRELLRLNRVTSLKLLDDFIAADPKRYIVLTDDQLKLAAVLWADVRKGGKPTADPHALDVDVILAAQANSLGKSNLVIATSNVAHLNRLVLRRTGEPSESLHAFPHIRFV